MAEEKQTPLTRHFSLTKWIKEREQGVVKSDVMNRLRENIKMTSPDADVDTVINSINNIFDKCFKARYESYG